MKAGLRYLAVCLALGVIGYFASEALFWSFRPVDTGIGQIALTCVAYAFAAGVALSAVLSTGLAGWRAVFLGGAIMGFGVEGAIVSTMYDGFPLQLVWTPLAWHALISGLFLFGGALAATRWALWRQVALMAALGAFGGIWSFYWPIERPTLPAAADTWIYLVGCGAAAMVALGVVARLLPGLQVSPRVLWVLPGLMLVLFAIQTIADPRPVRLAWPLMMAATFWAMRRLGDRTAPPAPLMPVPAWRFLPFLIVPALAALIATALLPTGGAEVNWPVALVTGALSLILWVRLLWQGYRASA